MHIKCLENRVNVQKCPSEPRKIPKFDTTLLSFYVDTRKIFKAITGNGYRFVPKGGTFPTETIRLVVRSSDLWESYTQTCPKWDKKNSMVCRVPFHDSMPGFMNFRRVLDLLEFKNQVSQCRVTVVGCFTFIPISCMGPKHATKDTYLNFQPIYMH